MLLYFSEQGIGEGTFLSSLESCCWFFFVCCWVHLLDNVRVYGFSFFIKRIEVLKYRNNNIEIRFSRANKFNSFFYSWQLLTKISNYVPLSHDLGEKNVPSWIFLATPGIFEVLIFLALSRPEHAIIQLPNVQYHLCYTSQAGRVTQFDQSRPFKMIS